MTEAQAHENWINRQLAKAGWSAERRISLEQYLPQPTSNQSEASEGKTQSADYVLLGREAKPIAIVEAECSSRDALAGKRQASDYANVIEEKFGFDPFVFLTTEEIVWFWERKSSAPYQISGFFSPSDLDRLTFLRRYRSSLQDLGPDPKIADRAYQQQAIKQVSEALTKGQRHFLLVMATGTGKTRTVIALIDLLMRARWIQRALFLVDRRELARQALGDFKEYLPHESRARIEGRQVNDKARIHVATYPSMMQVYQQLSPGYYDLIVADESHRSIYRHYRKLLTHFAGMQLGITATPTDYIDHNTFELFQCPDGLPTFYYPYETAVEEGYLVRYRALDAKTNFQLEGIKAGQLPPQIQQQLSEKGVDLSEINFEGSDIERRVTNTGTNDAIVLEFFDHCRKDPSGVLPAKTIFFAMSHRHAVELLESFRRVRADLQRRGLAEVIDSHVERADKLLDDFKYKDMPRVAISVDMLDTGIDMPAIQNLVFAKPVFSQVKFWQMIGRGARLWEDKTTGKKKDSFLIIDHWNNFAHFNVNPEGEVPSAVVPLPVRLFRARLAKLELLRAVGTSEQIAETIGQLQSMPALLPVNDANAQPHAAEIAALKQAETWLAMNAERVAHVSQAIAPLLRLVSEVNLRVMAFELRAEQLALAWLEQDAEEVDKRREQISADLKSLPVNLPQARRQVDQLAWMTSGGFWEHLDYGRIMALQHVFAPLMRYRQAQRRDIIKLTLPDRIVSRHWIIYGPSGEGAFADGYREQVEAQVRRLSEQLPALNKLKRGDSLGDVELQTLADALNCPDLFITEENLREAYEQPDADLLALLKRVLGLAQLPTHAQRITEVFDRFVHAHPHFTSTQISFLRTVRAAVLCGARLRREDLQRPPFSRVADVSVLFTADEQDEVLTLASRLAA